MESPLARVEPCAVCATCEKLCPYVETAVRPLPLIGFHCIENTADRKDLGSLMWRETCFFSAGPLNRSTRGESRMFISVLICTRNRAESLRLTLDSLFVPTNLQSPEWEAVV